MSPYSQRNAPAPRALGDEIPAGVRRAIMTWFHSQRDADLKAVRLAFFQKHGYWDVDDIANDIGDRWGDEARELFYYDLKNDPTVDQWNDGQKRRGAATAVSPFHVPAALYLDYLEGCVAAYAETRRYTWVESSFDVVDPWGVALPIPRPTPHLRLTACRRRCRRQARPGRRRSCQPADHAPALLTPARCPRQRGRRALRSGAHSLAIP